MEVRGAGALVAGGASGLGAATARALAAAGARVTIADLNPERGEALAAEIGAAFVPADVTDAAAVEAAVREAAAEGGLRISVCCAGIGWAERLARARGPHELEYFANVVKVNLIGSFNVLRLAAHAMLDNEPNPDGERGVCVNTASIAAFDGQIGQVAYAASKGGIVGMTLPAARDMASKGVRVVTIAPGLFDTPRGRPRGARRRHPLPLPPRPPRGVRRPGRPDRRQPDAERRGHPPRRRPADAAQIAAGAPADRGLRCAARGRAIPRTDRRIRRRRRSS
jgi:NAD(P)-dependent dehydrogenase (short-subunit alcohol dehydrogenase family)